MMVELFIYLIDMNNIFGLDVEVGDYVICLF